jgi:hypothetical protein
MTRGLEKLIVECPFCKNKTITVLHQPFVARKSLSKSRFGTGGPVYTKEKTEVLSGCSACGKSKIEIERALEGKEKISHEERINRLKKRGLPLKIENKY